MHVLTFLRHPMCLDTCSKIEIIVNLRHSNLLIWTGCMLKEAWSWVSGQCLKNMFARCTYLWAWDPSLRLVWFVLLQDRSEMCVGELQQELGIGAHWVQNKVTKWEAKSGLCVSRSEKWSDVSAMQAHNRRSVCYTVLVEAPIVNGKVCSVFSYFCVVLLIF